MTLPTKRSEVGTRQAILNAASKLMAKNGFMRTSLSDIAQEAQVTEPTIYQHFKGKEDLLFCAAEHHMEDYHHFLKEHLQGISGAYNRLRKLVWAHLRYSDINREYIILIIFECRANRNFYQSGAYKMVRQYSGTLLSILSEGVQEGAFRKGLNLKVVRDVIFGLLDYEAIGCVVTRETEEAAKDHEEVMRVVEGMLLSKESTAGSLAGDKRQRILSAAVQAFAEKGYANATISEIARGAGVAEGTVYEYFKNKEDLLLSLPEERFQVHLKQVEKAFDVGNPVRKLEVFIQQHFNLYLDERNFLLVFLEQIHLNRRFYQSRAYDSLRSYWQAFEGLIREIVDKGIVAPDFNIRIFRNMFLGAFTHMALRWFAIEQKGTMDKLSEIRDVTQMLVDVITASSSPGIRG